MSIDLNPEFVDHIAVAVKNLEEAIKKFERIGLKPYHTEEVADQKVKVAMIKVGPTNIELLEPTSEDSPIAKFIEKKGEGLHHVALRVNGLEEILNSMKEAGIRLIDEKPRLGAEGKKIAFIHPKETGILLELSEVEE